jgi:hypothetical protein
MEYAVYKICVISDDIRRSRSAWSYGSDGKELGIREISTKVNACSIQEVGEGGFI